VDSTEQERDDRGQTKRKDEEMRDEGISADPGKGEEENTRRSKQDYYDRAIPVSQ
jgi:hypothetical protein